MLPDPADVGLQRLGKLIGARLEAGRVIEENEVQPPQRLRYGTNFDAPADDRRKTLIERGRVRNFLQRYIGGHCIRRDHEHDRVGAGNQRLDAPPPILEGTNLSAIDKRLKAARFQSQFEPIHELQVLSRIGNEDARLRLSHVRGFGFRNHRRVPRRRRTRADSDHLEA